MLKRCLALFCLLFLGTAQAFMPQSGGWAINSELNGQPGRGIVLDAQNGTLVVTVFAYERTGHPTFYVAAGAVNADRFAAPLIRYEGGRFFGSGPRNGVETASPGTVNVRFTSGVTGFVTFPGEPELAISRFQFGYPFEAASLKGIWSVTRVVGSSVLGSAVQLDRLAQGTENGNGLIVSTDGLVGCEHQVRGSLAGNVLCVELDASGRLRRGYTFVYSVNEGEGIAVTSSGATEGIAFVRRLTTPRGVGTGIAFKSTAAERAMTAALRENIRMLADVAR